MIKNIFFDFDGVIADSVNVKTEAFRKLYQQYGVDIAEKAVAHHLANGGMSRFEKFKLYHKEFLGIDLDEKGIMELASQFSELVKEGVINASEVKGSHQFLHDHKETLNMFVITGTPTEESREICEARGIIDCFKGIYGSPRKKDYWSSYILDEFQLEQKDTIFVGDALADYEAAISNNLTFYLRENSYNIKLFESKKNIVRFNDFIEFRKLVKQK